MWCSSDYLGRQDGVYGSQWVVSEWEPDKLPTVECVFRPPGEVRMPSGQTACPHITDNKDGTVTVKYSPTERGLHEMDIKYDGNHIPGNTPTRSY